MEILNYLPEIIIGILFLIMVVGAVVTFIKASPVRKKEIICDILYNLAVKAEQEYGSKTGEIKKKEVIANFYARYPWIAYFISAENISTYIDEVVEKMTEYFKENTIACKNVLRTTSSDTSEEIKGE